MRTAFAVLALAATLLAFAIPATGAELRISSADTVGSVLAAHKGKRVSVRVRSGQEITGTVRDVTGNLVHLGAIAGKEFFDAVIPQAAIDAVIIRTKE